MTTYAKMFGISFLETERRKHDDKISDLLVDIIVSLGFVFVLVYILASLSTVK